MAFWEIANGSVVTHASSRSRKNLFQEFLFSITVIKYETRWSHVSFRDRCIQYILMSLTFFIAPSFQPTEPWTKQLILFLRDFRDRTVNCKNETKKNCYKSFRFVVLALYLSFDWLLWLKRWIIYDQHCASPLFNRSVWKSIAFRTTTAASGPYISHECDDRLTFTQLMPLSIIIIDWLLMVVLLLVPASAQIFTIAIAVLVVVIVFVFGRFIYSF